MRAIRNVLMLAALAASAPVAAQDHDPASAPVSDGWRARTARLDRARSLLERVPVGTTRIGGHYAVLAVGLPDSGPIAVVQVRNGRSITPGYEVVLVRRNGVNSRYEIVSHPGHAVLAIRTNVRARMGRTRRPTPAPAVYVPYGPELHDADAERAGLTHLRAVLAAARSRLDAADARSVRDPAVRLSVSVPERVLLAILIVEHMEPAEFRRSGASALAGRVLATIGLNGAEAYRYSVSSAQAGGIAQFIRSTYDATRNACPAAGLPRDFVAAMQDHAVAATAQYCLADMILARLSDGQRARLADPEDLGAYVAASYNGGADRAVTALSAFPRSWDRRGHGLVDQTVLYVEEFRAVYRLLGQ